MHDGESPSRPGSPQYEVTSPRYSPRRSVDGSEGSPGYSPISPQYEVTSPRLSPRGSNTGSERPPWDDPAIQIATSIGLEADGATGRPTSGDYATASQAQSTAEDNVAAQQGTDPVQAHAQTIPAAAPMFSGTGHSGDAHAQCCSTPELGADQHVSDHAPEAASKMSTAPADSPGGASTAQPSTAGGNRADRQPARRSGFCFDKKPAAVQPAAANAKLDCTSVPAQGAAPAAGHAQAGTTPATAEGPTPGLPGAALDPGPDANKQPQEAPPTADSSLHGVSASRQAGSGHAFAWIAAGATGEVGSGSSPFTAGTAPFTPGAAPFTPGAAPFTPGAAPFTPGAAPFTPGAAPFTPSAAPFTPGSAPFTGGGPFTSGSAPFNGFQAGAGTAKPFAHHASPSGKTPGKCNASRGSSAYTPSSARKQPGSPQTAPQQSDFAIGAHHCKYTAGSGQHEGSMRTNGAPGPNPSTDAKTSNMSAFGFDSWGQQAFSKDSPAGEQPSRVSFAFGSAAHATPATAPNDSASMESGSENGIRAVPAFGFTFGQAAGSFSEQQSGTSFTFGSSTDCAAADSWQQQHGT